MLLAAMLLAAAPDYPPVKMVLTWSAGGVTTTDYPNIARCVAAKRAIEAEAARRIEESRRNVTPGAVLLGTPYVVQSFCIPG